jgi:magnesium transporter
MLTVYNANESGLITLMEPDFGCWLNAVDPSPADIARLQSLGIPEDFITSPLDVDERSRTERENGEI